MDKSLKKVIADLNQDNPRLFNKLYNKGRAVTIPLKSINEIIPSGKIVDIGCGSGIISMYLVLKDNKRTITGYDLNKYRIDNLNRTIKGKKEYKNLKFYSKDFTIDRNIPLAENVIMIDLLHHIDYDSQIKLLTAVKNKIKKNGKLIIKEINKDNSYKHFTTWVLDKIITRGDKIYYRKIVDWKNILKECGYEIKEVKKIKSIAYPHFAIIAIPK